MLITSSLGRQRYWSQVSLRPHLLKKKKRQTMPVSEWQHPRFLPHDLPQTCMRPTTTPQNSGSSLATEKVWDVHLKCTSQYMCVHTDLRHRHVHTQNKVFFKREHLNVWPPPTTHPCDFSCSQTETLAAKHAPDIFPPLTPWRLSFHFPSLGVWLQVSYVNDIKVFFCGWHFTQYNVLRIYLYCSMC